MEQIVKYFTDKGSSIYLCALDANKGFDLIDHNKLSAKVYERNPPVCN